MTERTASNLRRVAHGLAVAAAALSLASGRAPARPDQPVEAEVHKLIDAAGGVHGQVQAVEELAHLPRGQHRRLAGLDDVLRAAH